MLGNIGCVRSRWEWDPHLQSPALAANDRTGHLPLGGGLQVPPPRQEMGKVHLCSPSLQTGT